MTTQAVNQKTGQHVVAIILALAFIGVLLYLFWKAGPMVDYMTRIDWTQILQERIQKGEQVSFWEELYYASLNLTPVMLWFVTIAVPVAFFTIRNGRLGTGGGTLLLCFFLAGMGWYIEGAYVEGLREYAVCKQNAGIFTFCSQDVPFIGFLLYHLGLLLLSIIMLLAAIRAAFK